MTKPQSLTRGLTGFSLGYSGIRFLREKELDDGQRGYSIGLNGESLVGNVEGDWKSSWLVIGYDESCGDPIFVDTRASALPVYTAMHGTGDWTPRQIADTLEAFKKSIRIIFEIAEGRENPVRLDANPISQALRMQTLNEIKSLNPSSTLEFWDLMMGFY